MRVNYIISFIEKVAIVLVVIVSLGGTFSVASAFGEEHREHNHGHVYGHGHDRGLHKGERHYHGHDRHWREGYAPEPYYPPVYAPPEPVVVAPPPPSPGINIIFPIHIH